MLFAEDQHMIHAVAPQRPNQALNIGIVKSSPLHLFRLIGRRRSWLPMPSIPFIGASSRL